MSIPRAIGSTPTTLTTIRNGKRHSKPTASNEASKFSREDNRDSLPVSACVADEKRSAFCFSAPRQQGILRRIRTRRAVARLHPLRSWKEFAVEQTILKRSNSMKQVLAVQ